MFDLPQLVFIFSYYRNISLSLFDQQLFHIDAKAYRWSDMHSFLAKRTMMIHQWNVDGIHSSGIEFSQFNGIDEKYYLNTMNYAKKVSVILVVEK